MTRRGGSSDLVAHTPAEGGTNIEEAIKLGGELALRHLDPQAQNRMVMLTDGAANLGDADPAQLATAIETMRQQGISFDACGVGTDGLDDCDPRGADAQGRWALLYPRLAGVGRRRFCPAARRRLPACR